MTSLNKFSSINIMLFQLFTDLVILLNLPYIRQVAGFIYLTFVPGFAVLKALKWENSDFLKRVLYAVGLSIALLMFFGLLVSELGYLAGFESPLNTLSLLVVFNIVVQFFCFLDYFREPSDIHFDLPRLYEFAFFAIPILSIIATIYIANFGQSYVSLLLILVVINLVVLVTFYKKFPSRSYALLLLLIALSLLWHGSFVGNYISGWDVNSEYHVFEMTETEGYWNRTLFYFDNRITKGNAMLSVTILPTVYSKITGLDGTWILKILYPFILSFEVLAIYYLYCKQFKAKVSFLSVFFVIFSLTFFAPDCFVYKQMASELFFVLLLLLFFEKEKSSLEKNSLFVIFSFALIVSHYSISYIFLFVISLAWLYFLLTGKSHEFTLNKILIFSTIAFSWYIFASNTASFDAILGVGNHIMSSFVTDFFSFSSRSTTVLRGIGATEAISMEHQIGRIFFYILEGLVLLGFMRVILKKKSVTLDREYVFLCFVFMVILGANVVIPNLAETFRMERFYHISMLVVAPLGIIGADTFSRLFFRRKDNDLALSLALIILVINFLFETGFIYEVSGDYSYYLPLGLHKTKSLERLVITQREVFGAEWLSTKINILGPKVYADFISTSNLLTSYGMQTMDNLYLLSNITKPLGDNTFIFLRQENVVNGTFMMNTGLSWNISDATNFFENYTKVYSNGAAQIFRAN